MLCNSIDVNNFFLISDEFLYLNILTYPAVSQKRSNCAANYWSNLNIWKIWKKYLQNVHNFCNWYKCSKIHVCLETQEWLCIYSGACTEVDPGKKFTSLLLLLFTQPANLSDTVVVLILWLREESAGAVVRPYRGFLPQMVCCWPA